MSKSRLIIMASPKMDSNKKKNRDEKTLVRVSSAVRDYVGIHKDKVEVWPADSSTESRIKKSLMLTPFQAYKEDLSRLKSMVEEGSLTEEQYKRIGFVTTSVFNKICGSVKVKNKGDIWVSNDIEDTVIGTDPEFLLFEKDTNKVVKANSVLSYQGNPGCDGAMAEIRPLPSITVDDHVRNIQKIFRNKTATKKILEYRWLTSCYHKDNERDYPVGGHIHVGNPAKVAELSSARKQNLFSVLNKIMDELLAIPMIKFDGKKNGNARRTKCTMGRYGWYGGFRTDLGRLEHRTLSGMWLLHPSLTKAVLGTAKLIIDSVFKLVEAKGFDSDYILPSKLSGKILFHHTFDQWADIPLTKDMGCTKSSKDMVEMLNKSKTEAITASYLNTWLSKIRKFPAYKKYSNYAECLNEMLRLKIKEIEALDRDIKNNWLSGKKFIVDL